ncbi:PaaI family thioesterase [Marinobacter sp. LN3S78]|uniref:PaaI family thioesterase n=1 Tax=Marinobacter sp. LN3S78 TaxID=3382300 RepID=UPI00387AB04B
MTDMAITRNSDILVPEGFPALGDLTSHRQMLNEILDGTDITPPAVVNFGLPFAVPCNASWSCGRFEGEFTPEGDVFIKYDVVFGGYVASVIDQFAGLATSSMLPDGWTYLTAQLDIGFKAPLKASPTVVKATIDSLSHRKAICDVVLLQDDLVVSRGRVTEILVPPN